MAGLKQFVYCLAIILMCAAPMLGSNEKYPVKIDILTWQVQHETVICGPHGTWCYHYTLWERAKNEDTNVEFWLMHDCGQYDGHQDQPSQGGCGHYIIGPSNDWPARYVGSDQMGVLAAFTRADGSTYTEELVFQMR